jgi:hypothetical protein
MNGKDLMRPKDQRRVPEGKHENLVLRDVLSLLRMAFAPSHCGVAANQRTNKANCVAPFINCLLNHPEITQGPRRGRVSARVVSP